MFPVRVPLRKRKPEAKEAIAKKVVIFLVLNLSKNSFILILDGNRLNIFLYYEKCVADSYKDYCCEEAPHYEAPEENFVSVQVGKGNHVKEGVINVKSCEFRESYKVPDYC